MRWHIMTVKNLINHNYDKSISCCNSEQIHLGCLYKESEKIGQFLKKIAEVHL